MRVAALVALAALFAGPAHAAGLTERQACLKLIGTARALHLAGENKRGDYRCKRHATDADFVFTLRFDGPKEPADASHLLGHYAVDKATRDVYEWDVTTQKRGVMLVPPKRKR
ncbi:hypothetical protein [Roseateles sp. P5_E7]